MKDYTFQEVYAMVQAGQACKIIDVREAHEYVEGHIPGAELIPLAQFSHHPEDILPPTDEPLFLYCTAGYRAGLALELLRNAGYEQVYNLGSIEDWPGELVKD